MANLPEELEGLDPSRLVLYLVRQMYFLTTAARETCLAPGVSGPTSGDVQISSTFNEMTYHVSGQTLAVSRGSQGYPWVTFFAALQEIGAGVGNGEGLR
jgi:hypothetical protein